jgi:LPXTG-site transpeptidase (sortase) family protein
MAFYVYKKRQPKLVSPKIRKSAWIPIGLFLVGITIIGYMSYPYANFYLAKYFKIDNLSKKFLTPQDTFTVYAADANVSADYNHNVATNIAEVNSEISHTTSSHPDLATETGNMYITISKLGLNHIPVTINTESSNEAEYNRVLSHSVAHFKGTSLPPYPGNTFLYGHSSRSLFNGGARTFSSGIFTDIDELNLGDEIIMEYKDHTYKYSVSMTRLVEMNDLSVISGNEQHILSLMTCKPDGIGSSRFIVTAILDEN